MGKVTLQTIADELGVSRTTVSNAFSRPDQLSDDLRARILESADRLGYTGPNPAARNLRRGRAGVLGVVLKESLAYAFSDPYAIAFLGGLATEAEAARLGLLLIPCPPGTDQTDGVRDAVVDAFCVFSLPDGHHVVEAALARGLPTVFVDGPHREGHPFVGIDNRVAMADVARHLTELGHRRVAILSFRLVGDDRVGPVDDERLGNTEYQITAQRLAGAIAELRSAGVDPSVYEVGINTRESARAAAAELLVSDAAPSAMLCLSDTIALGVLDAATELGLQVPRQLSVTGFDDIPRAEPAGLTTVRQSAADKGRRAGQVLLSGETREILLPHDLVVRSTTAVALD